MGPRLILHLVCASAFLFHHAACFSGTSSIASKRVVVVGKIIVDEYGDPSKSEAPTISIGGGGPQAALGAAAALAVRDLYDENGNCPLKSVQKDPPPMSVTFLGAVGNDWESEDTAALASILTPALDKEPVLIPSDDHITPRIRLWHDEEQNIQWYAVNDSFGPVGADGLWRNRPSAHDILLSLDGKESDECVVHMICEAGEKAASQGMDSEPLRVDRLLERVAYVSVEPIAFPDERGKVAPKDAQSCINLIDSLPKLDLVCPDEHLDAAMQELNFEHQERFCKTVRKGPEGSVVHGRDEEVIRIPATKLLTEYGEPVNPTGAGNAYCGAISALLGTGSPLVEAAAIASSVGAAICEYEQVFPYNWSVLDRIYSGSREVAEKISSQEAKKPMKVTR